MPGSLSIRRKVDHMRLYTLIPIVSGTITEWSSKLAQIKQMGFDTVHLLPLTTLDTSRSPYSAKDLFSVEPRYVTGGAAGDGLAELEQFVETARSLEIRLCFDLVLIMSASTAASPSKPPCGSSPTRPDPMAFAAPTIIATKDGFPGMTWS